jgi:hypothetical protein
MKSQCFIPKKIIDRNVERPFFCYANIPIYPIPLIQRKPIIWNRLCKRCSKLISISNFSIRPKKIFNKNGWYYINSWCDDCVKSYDKKWKTPERIKQANDKKKKELTDGYVIQALKQLKYYHGFPVSYFKKHPQLIINFREYLIEKRKEITNGTKIHKHKKWSKIDVNILLILYKTHTAKELSIIFNRNIECIYNKIKRLKN